MSDTPETDTTFPVLFHEGGEWVQIDDMRKMERERNEARRKAESLRTWVIQLESMMEEEPPPIPLPWES